MTRYQMRICIFSVLRQHCAGHRAACKHPGCPDRAWSCDRDEFARALLDLRTRFGDGLADELVLWRNQHGHAEHLSVDQTMRVCDRWMATAEVRGVVAGSVSYLRLAPGAPWHVMRGDVLTWCGRELDAPVRHLQSAALAISLEFGELGDGRPVCAECLAAQR